MSVTPFITGARRDIAYSLRLLRRTPGFAVVAIATLALGIGASTAIFTVVSCVLLRPLRFADPSRLAMILTDNGARLSQAYLHDWRAESRTLQDVAGWYDARMNLTGSQTPLELRVDRVTANFFDVLGVPVSLGRSFKPATDLDRADPEVILSDGFWQTHFGANPAVLGRVLVLDGQPYTVVGVMPPGLKVRTNELSESQAEVWIPFALSWSNRVGMGGNLNVIARLAPGATFDDVRAELSLISARIEQAYPSYSHRWRLDVLPLRDATVRDVRLTLLVLLGAVGLLLLISCANVASLILSRAATRQAEIAIRRSLGATTGRIVGQFIAESLTLAVTGGLLGILVGEWITRIFVATLPNGVDIPRVSEIHLDLNVVAFSFAVTVMTAVLLGLVPAFGTARLPSSALMRSTSRSMSSGRRTRRLHGSMIVAEVALAVVLLSGAGLLTRSFLALTAVDPGFRPDHVVTMRTTLPATRYAEPARVRGFGADLIDRVARIPGVENVGLANYLPLSQSGEAAMFDIEGRPARSPDDQPSSWVSVVGGRYFEAMGIPLLRGRLPTSADQATTRPVFVIDETLARRYWPEENPVGRRVVSHVDGGDISGEIVGVVGSVHWTALSGPLVATTYLWFPQAPRRELTIAARVSGDPLAAASLIAAAVRAVDPGQPVADVQTMKSSVSADLARPRFTVIVLGCFGAAAILLAALGIYGLVAFSVGQRSKEIGVRVALGAQPGDVISLMMRRSLGLIAGGLAAGLAAAAALGRVVTALLFGVSAADPVTLVAVLGLLTLVGGLASYLPARRAVAINPVAALRAE